MAIEKKLRPEGLDFFLAATAPIFIIGMIGSLVYFVITVCYQGSFTERLMWILGLYTVAAVLIARIAIEQSRQLAYTYMFVLAAATLVVTPQFFVVSGAMAVFSFPILICLLVMVAVLADRITFDCTSMNEQVQSTGVGLLQSLGLVKSERNQTMPKSRAASANAESPNGKAIKKKSGTKRKHNPGVWVLYFALLALPLFGLGQMVIQSPGDRRWAFTYLFIYLLSSLFLLVLISLLSLRKYLRERGVPMETSFAIRWLAIGMTSVFTVLFVLSLLPIPSQSFLSMELPFRISSQDDLKVSQWGWGGEGAKGEGPKIGKEVEGKPQGQPAANQKPQENKNAQQNDPKQGDGKPSENQSDGQQDGKSQSADGTQKGDKQGDGKKGKPGGEPKKNDPAVDKNDQSKPEERNPLAGEKPPPKDKDGAERRQPDQAPDQQNQQQQQNQQVPSMAIQWNFSAGLQWLVMLILLIVSIVFGVKYRRELATSIKDFGDWLRALLGRKNKSIVPLELVDEVTTTIADLYPPFHTFANPFAAGSGWSREQMVRYMYRAVLSWGYEHRVVRREDETPEEFIRRLARRYPEQQEYLSLLGVFYNRIAYARGAVSQAELKPMTELWQWLSKSSAK